MKSPHIKVHLDNNRFAFKCGETISGRADCLLDKDTKHNGIFLVLRVWIKSGDGNNTLEEQKRVLISPPGVSKRFESINFSTELPDGPISFQGKIMELVWLLQVEMDAIFKTYSSNEVTLSIAEASMDRYYKFDLRTGLDEAFTLSIPKLKKQYEWEIFNSGWFLFLLGYVSYSLFGFAELEAIAVAQFLFTCLGAFLLLWSLPNILPKIRLGTPRVELTPKPLQLGREASLKLTITPWTSFALTEIIAVLSCQEHSIPSDTGDSRRRHYRCQRVQEIIVQINRVALANKLGARGRLRRGQEQTFEGRFMIPSDAPPSFISIKNSVEWQLRIKVGISRWLDWRDKRDIVVRP